MTATLQHDPLGPGAGVLTASSPAELCDAVRRIVPVIAAPGDAMAVWALHPSEQDVAPEQAYAEDRALVGGADVRIHELARPRQHNVIWVDRYHLLVRGADPSAAWQLMGLYVASAGECIVAIHHPSVAFAVSDLVERLPGLHRTERFADAAFQQVRCAFYWNPSEPGQLAVAAPPSQLAMMAGVLAGTLPGTPPGGPGAADGGGPPLVW